MTYVRHSLPAMLSRDTLCCIYGKVPFGFGVYRDVWTLRDLVRVLDHHNTNYGASAGEARPLGVSEGGVEWPGTAASSAQWRADTASRDASDSVVSRQMRMCNDGGHRWPRIPDAPPSTWSADLLDREIGRGVLGFRAKCSPSLGMIADLMASFRACSCPLAYTDGVAHRFGRFAKKKTRTWYLKPTGETWGTERDCDCDQYD